MYGKVHRIDLFEVAKAYFRQPLFDKQEPLQLNPIKFRKGWRIRLLERSWQLDYAIEAYRLNLETGWQAKPLSAESS